MPVSTDKPITSVILTEAIIRLLETYPHIEHTTIGMSCLGRPIHSLVAGSGPRVVLINAAHHANEWITSLVALRFFEECAKCPEWQDKATLHCIPMVNPDGVDLVVGWLGRLRFVYKKAEEMATQDPQPFPECWKANICGVDLNSNYPAGWDLAKAHKFARGYTAPSPRDYVGAKPLSEPESCAMVAYTTMVAPDITLSLHTQGEEIYWRYKDFLPTGAAEMAERFSTLSGYLCQDVPSESSHAGYRDWFIETFNRPGFTIECGLGENPLPLSQFDDIYQKVSPMLRDVLYH